MLPRGLPEAGVEKYLPCLVRIMTLLRSGMDQAGPNYRYVLSYSSINTNAVPPHVVADLVDVSEALQCLWRRSRARTGLTSTGSRTSRGSMSNMGQAAQNTASEYSCE